MKMRSQYTCPLEMTHDIIKGKWKPLIIWQLSKGGSSLSALKKSIRGISQKMLVQHLNELLECGVIGKLTNDGYPLKSEYFLTERGKRIFGAISIMQSIGIEMMLEDDYGMIDGIINNGPKERTVAQLEQQARSGQPISLMDLAAAAHREERDKKKSVMEQLKSQPRTERKKAAPKKSAEREI